MTVERIVWSIVQLTVMVQVDKHLREPIRFQSELTVLVGSEMLQRAFFKIYLLRKVLLTQPTFPSGTRPYRNTTKRVCLIHVAAAVGLSLRCGKGTYYKVLRGSERSHPLSLHPEHVVSVNQDQSRIRFRSRRRDISRWRGLTSASAMVSNAEVAAYLRVSSLAIALFE